MGRVPRGKYTLHCILYTYSLPGGVPAPREEYIGYCILYIVYLVLPTVGGDIPQGGLL